MRWIVALVALAAGVWYLRNRQRRDQLQDTWQETAPSGVKTQVDEAATAAREAAEQAKGVVGDTNAETAQQAAQSLTEKAHDLASAASKSVGDAAANVQHASEAAIDRIQQATEAASGHSDGAVTDGAPATVEAETEADTPAPSVHDTVQAELAGVGEAVDTIRDTTQAPAEPAEKSAGAAFGAGTLNSADMQTVQAPATPDVTETPTTPDVTEVPTTGMEQPPEIDRAGEVFERTSGDFIGNKNTRVFHAATSGNLPSEENRVYFESEQEAIDAGFRPAER